jgi:uridine kinase
MNCISYAEAGYDAQIKEAVRRLTSNPTLTFITLSGPTCSGKTTSAKRLTDELISCGHRVHVISIDNFFRNNSEIDRKNANRYIETDYDSAGALDLRYFAECAHGITEKRRVYLPTFNFLTGLRSGYTLFEPCEDNIVIFEGLQAIYPEVLSLLPADKCGQLHVSVDEDMTVCGQSFTRREIRLIRRIVRDYKFRGASPEFTLFLWNSVVKNEDINIIPYTAKIPIRINTLLLYEMNMIKNDFIMIMAQVRPDSRYYEDCTALTSRFDSIPAINKSYLPSNSVYREFLG